MIDRTALEARAKALGFTFPLTNTVRGGVWSMLHAENVQAWEREQMARIALANEQMATASDRMADGFEKP